MTAVAPDHSRARWLAPLLVVVLGAVAYSNSFHGPFFFDDMAAIVENPQICSLNPFKYPPLGPSTVAGRPVAIFSFAANYKIGRLHVEGYHIINLLIHLLAGLVLYGVVRRTLVRIQREASGYARSGTWLAAMIAALWVVHPLNTQSITYIVQRAESLASLFILLTIYGLIRAADGSRFWAIAAILACAFGMATKEIVAAAPILALIYDRAFLAGSFKQALTARWKLYTAMAASWSLILLSLDTGMRGSMVGFHLGMSALEYARTELNVIALYLRLAFWPTNLVLDYYDWPLARNWSDVQWQGWLVLGLVIATLVTLVVRPRIGFLGAWFFLILAPTSSFLPIKEEAAAEQRMYAPLMAVICFVVIAIWLIVHRRRAMVLCASLVGCVAIALLAHLTMDRNALYANPVDIWTETIAQRPNNTRAHVNLGESYARLSAEFPAGSAEGVGAAREALDQFEIVWQLEPNLNETVFAIGQSFDRLGNPGAAEDFYTQSLASHPAIREGILVERGMLRARRKDWPEARSDFQSAIDADPTNPEPHYYLALLYQQVGDLAHTESELTTVVALSPKYKNAAELLSKLCASPSTGK